MPHDGSHSAKDRVAELILLERWTSPIRGAPRRSEPDEYTWSPSQPVAASMAQHPDRSVDAERVPHR
jgi:hypothetical protein